MMWEALEDLSPSQKHATFCPCVHAQSPAVAVSTGTPAPRCCSLPCDAQAIADQSRAQSHHGHVTGSFLTGRWGMAFNQARSLLCRVQVQMVRNVVQKKAVLWLPWAIGHRQRIAVALIAVATQVISTPGQSCEVQVAALHVDHQLVTAGTTLSKLRHASLFDDRRECLTRVR